VCSVFTAGIIRHKRRLNIYVRFWQTLLIPGKEAWNIRPDMLEAINTKQHSETNAINTKQHSETSSTVKQGLQLSTQSSTVKQGLQLSTQSSTAKQAAQWNKAWSYQRKAAQWNKAFSCSTWAWGRRASWWSGSDSWSLALGHRGRGHCTHTTHTHTNNCEHTRQLVDDSRSPGTRSLYTYHTHTHTHTHKHKELWTHMAAGWWL